MVRADLGKRVQGLRTGEKRRENNGIGECPEWAVEGIKEVDHNTSLHRC